MAGVVEQLRGRLADDSRALDVEDLLMDEESMDEEPMGFDPSDEAEDPLFDGLDDELNFDLGMTERPEDFGGEQDIEALREALIERARDRHMATDEFQHAIAGRNRGR